MTDTLKFRMNVSETVEFRFDTPKTGLAKSGPNKGQPYWLYSVRQDGKETSFFATALLNATLERADVKEGTTAIITQLQREDDLKKVYWTVQVGKNVYTSDEATQGRPPSQITKEPTITERPCIADLVRTYQFIKEELEKIGIDGHEPVATVFIQASRLGEIVRAGDAKSEVRAMGEEIPPEEEDDLPF